MRFRKILATILCLTLILSAFSGCSNNNKNNSKDNSNDDNIETSETLLSYDNMFSDRDFEIGYDEDLATTVSLNNDESSINGDGAKFSDNKVTISKDGTYVISGSLSNGQIVVDCNDTAKPHIILNNISIENSSSAPIYVKNADKVFITLAKNSENSLINNGEFVSSDDNKVDAVIFSKDDITINGDGELNVATEYGNGITSKDDLKITGGNITVTSSGHGLEGKDSIRIADGTINIISQKDGIHSDNSEDATLGFVYINNGEININSTGDGISASYIGVIDGGNYSITTDGGSDNATPHQNQEMWGGGKHNGFFGNSTTTQTSDQIETTSNEESETSTKAIKSSDSLTINGGVFEINSKDDSIHSNNNVTINDGTFTMSSGDDGIHADSNLTIKNGTITISTCYEGLEGQNIDIKGGIITLTASDDGFNAAGGKDITNMNKQDMFKADENAYINISGGTINIKVSGDGIDSNGSLSISGGETYVSGPTSDGDAPLDYTGTAQITGGIIVAAGSKGMAQNFCAESTQCSILATSTNSTDGAISLKDSDGNEIVSYQPQCKYSCVIISAPQIKTDDEYTLSMGDEDKIIEMTSTIYGNAGNGMGNMGGMNGNRPDRQPAITGENGDFFPQVPNNENMPQTPPNGNAPQMNGNGNMYQRPNKPINTDVTYETTNE